jgi:glycosyltransferase involved in cell wall biosynthesis
MRDFFLAYCAHHRRDAGKFARYLRYAHGQLAEPSRPERIDDPDRLKFPLFAPAVRGALGVVTHSHYASGRVAGAVPVPVRAIDFPLFGPCQDLAREAPSPRAGDAGRVRLLTFGVLLPNKLVHTTIEAIGRSSLLRERVQFEVIGSGDPGYVDQLRLAIHSHGLGDIVTLGGWRSDAELKVALVSADVVVNLRNPHHGESSASLLDALISGCATVVWDHGFYGEFPDDVVIKVRSEASLVQTLERLARDSRARQQYGARARAHALERFDTARYCHELRAFAAEVYQGKPAIALADRVSAVLTEMGSTEIDGLPDRIAAAIAGLLPNKEQTYSLPLACATR